MVTYLVQLALLLFVALYAWKRGGNAERHVTFILITIFVATTVHGMAIGQWTQYHSIPWFRVGLDVFGLAGFLFIALRADRWWPLWVVSVQLLSVLAHVLRVTNAALPPRAYAVLERWPFWIAILMTALGTYSYARRSRTASTG